MQDVSAIAGAIAFNTAVNDLLEISVDLTGANLNNGTGLLTAVGNPINVAANANAGYIAAYADGKAYLYFGSDLNANATLDAAEIQLIGVFNGVAAGAFVAGNFSLV